MGSHSKAVTVSTFSSSRSMAGRTLLWWLVQQHRTGMDVHRYVLKEAPVCSETQPHVPCTVVDEERTCIGRVVMASLSHDVSTRVLCAWQTSDASHIRAMAYHNLQECGWASIQVCCSSVSLHQSGDHAA